MKRNLLAMLALSASCFISIAADSAFFRVVSTQETQITSITKDRVITWSNEYPNVESHLEWTPSLDGIWITNDLPGTIQSTGIISQAIFDEVFITGNPSTIVSPPIGDAVTIDFMKWFLDVNNDGNNELTFEYGAVTTYDEPPTEYEEFIDVRGSAVIIAPQQAETLLGPPSDNSSDYQYFKYGFWLVHSGIYPTGTNGWEYGPWAGITNAFLPFQFVISDKLHYGWINIAFPSDQIIEFKACAYETIPGKGIIAGATK